MERKGPLLWLLCLIGLDNWPGCIFSLSPLSAFWIWSNPGGSGGRWAFALPELAARPCPALRFFPTHTARAHNAALRVQARCGKFEARRTAPFPPILRPPELCRHMDPRVSPASILKFSHKVCSTVFQCHTKDVDLNQSATWNLDSTLSYLAINISERRNLSPQLNVCMYLFDNILQGFAYSSKQLRLVLDLIWYLAGLKGSRFHKPGSASQEYLYDHLSFGPIHMFCCMTRTYPKNFGLLKSEFHIEGNAIVKLSQNHEKLELDTHTRRWSKLWHQGSANTEQQRCKYKNRQREYRTTKMQLQK